MQNIAVIVGSLRKDSWNRKLANILIKLGPKSLRYEIIDIANLPLYNQDPDDQGHPHPEWINFREKIKSKQGVLFVTPEYNRSIPAPLKNALDVGSRPYGKSVWTKKPCAVISASIGQIGGFGANQHLRQTFVFLDMPCLQQPEAYIAEIQNLIDEKGNLSKENTKTFLTKFMESFSEWVLQFNHEKILS